MISCCSSAVRMPSAAAARKSASLSNLMISLTGSRAGQMASVYVRTGLLRATASWTRSSGDSPVASIRSSIW